MLNAVLGISGSTILSNKDKIEELFTFNLSHIEIGELENLEDYEYFYSLVKKHNTTYGVHSPLIRGNSKYDLIEKVQIDCEQAWLQLEKEAEYLSKRNCSYLLVHFPYFKGEASDEPNKIIEEGLKKLKRIQDTYKIQIVCEPKLGMNRSAKGIEYLHDFPLSAWNKYSLAICIDVGDYMLAKGEEGVKYAIKWKDYAHVVHLHHIEDSSEKYIWTPVHPSNEKHIEPSSIKDYIREFGSQENTKLILEHTPHRVPSKHFVLEGINWIKDTLDNK
jgi:sugar phosphate isomerase/epimerase